MTLLQHLLHVTNFRSPFLRTVVPSVSAAFAIQTAFAIPSIVGQSERFYDASGALTFLSVTLLSLYLPGLRAKSAAALKGTELKLPSLLSPFLNGGAAGGFNWRQVALSAAVAFWSIRRMYTTRLSIFLLNPTNKPPSGVLPLPTRPPRRERFSLRRDQEVAP
jgi:hypothetical protein